MSYQNDSEFIFETKVKRIAEIFNRNRFEESIDGYLEESRQVINKTLKQANLKPVNINKIIMTGGSSLIPKFKLLVEEIFGKEKVLVYEPFTAVSKGLALVSSKKFI